MTRCITCVKAARRDRAERRSRGEEVPKYSEEERRVRSERAIQLHAEGKLGGPQPGAGRPRKPRMTDAVLEHFQENLPLVIRAIESNLRSKNKAQRERAAEFLITLEQTEDKRLRDARGAGKDPTQMTREELIELITQGMMAMIQGGDVDLMGQIVDLTDADVQELPVSTAA